MLMMQNFYVLLVMELLVANYSDNNYMAKNILAVHTAKRQHTSLIQDKCLRITHVC